ncbi:YifB family Mg chelatase-like AAA ATPase [Naumannella halotolerans]|uniref:YifB family Mg chelatase-like AAA ATPase n=1 Tax=Naumannella halotolerans TaxID=993414 RepID=UPI00370D6A50
MSGQMVEIEVSVGSGLPRTVLVGLPDAALYEARDRCRAAVSNCGLQWPVTLTTINLTPASLPKAGSHYDLGIVAAVLCATGVGERAQAERTVFLGELGLDGRVRPTRGVLPALMAARTNGFERAVVAAAQLPEATLVDGIAVHAVADLEGLVGLLRGGPGECVAAAPAEDEETAETVGDLGDVVGQLQARWALEVAAAGRHHLFFSGPPGVGKTMLAERLPGILPELSAGQALEVLAIRSISGLPIDHRLPRRPPFAGPHHNASVASMVGGGSRIAAPGAVSMAHHGVLFLDEAAEFSPRVLDALRTPLETGSVTLARSAGQVTYPARFQLIMAANPCPCGQSGQLGGRCQCTPTVVRRYRSRLSGPVLDRIDIQTTLHPVGPAVLSATDHRAESSAVVADRVREARARQLHRLRATPWLTNAEASGAWIRRHWPPPAEPGLLSAQIRRGAISARGAEKVVRLSWTIADLGGHDRPTRADLQLALALRRGDDVQRVVDAEHSVVAADHAVVDPGRGAVS